MATYYIDFVAGSDSNNGTSTSTPWKRVKGDSNATGTAAGATLAAGDTIVFKGGVVYLGGFTISTSGTSGNPIVYDGSGATWGTGKAIIDREYLRNGVCINLAKSVSHVTVKGFELRHAGGWADDDPVVTGANNTTPITINTGGTGVSLYSGGNSHVLIEDIYAHRIGGWRNTAGWQRVAIQGSAVAMLNANNITVRGIEVTKTAVGVRVASSTSTDNIVVEDCDMHNYITWGVDVTANATNAAFSNIHIRRNSIYNTAEFDDGNWSGVPNDNHPHTNGVFVRRNHYDSTWDNVRISENRFWCDDRGSSTGGTACVFVSSGPSVIIYNNVMDRDAKTRGISIAYPNYNTQKQVVRIYNNFIRTTGAIVIENAGEANPAKREIHIQNNILLQAPGTRANWVILYNQVSPLPDTLNNNIYLSVGWNVSQKFILSPNWSKFADLQAAGFEANGAYIDPLIVDLSDSPVANNNRLLTASSPARSAGANLSSFFSTDAAGNSRPTSGAWDVGPFQYQPPVATYHVTQSGAGSANGTSEANAWSVSDFNTSGNWSSTPGTSGKISPGDTVRLVGTLATPLAVQASGTKDNPITVLFEKDAKMSSPAWPSTGAIVITKKDYITIEGGENGKIENTANGSPGSFPTQTGSVGILATDSSFLRINGVKIINMYVRTSEADTNGGGTGVRIVPSASSSFRSIRVTNCTVSDVETGIAVNYRAHLVSDVEIDGNTVFNVNHGIRIGDAQTGSSCSNVRIHNNVVYGFSRWDEPGSNKFHHNGIFCFATNASSQITNLSVYSNKIGSDYGAHSTSGIYLSGWIFESLIYNNVLLGDINTPTNGLVTLRLRDGGRVGVYNNTFIGNGKYGRAIHLNGEDGGSKTADIANNIATNITFISTTFSNSWILSSDYNLGQNLIPSREYSFSSTSSGSFRTPPQWRGMGHDLNGYYADAFLNSAYVPNKGSPAIDSGKDLSQYFKTDKNGVLRPVGAGWDIGAFQSGSPVTVHHVTQSGAGAANGTSQANAWSVTQLNTSSNWSATEGTAGKISPGDTVMLHGTFTSGIIVRGSGQSANRITILFADNAKFSAPAFNGIVIDVGQRSYVTIDGGTNGIIENTDNGTPGSFGNTVNTTGVRIQQAVGVHVTRLLFRNLYQRTSTTDANYSAGSSGIEQKPSNAIYGFSGTRISYCTFHDMSRGVGFTAGDTSGDIEVHDCTIYNVDDGVVMAPGWNDRTLDGAKVYRNRIYGFSKWDDANPANQWHHDGVHVFAVAPGSSYHNVHVFNNVIGPDYGNRATSGIYMSGYLGNGNLIYQNILFSKTGDNPNNGQIFTRPGPGSGTLRIYNNVSLGEGQGVGISITGQDSGAARSVTLANNIAVGITAVAVYYHERITLTSNRNLLYDAPSSFPGAYVYSIGNNASPRTIEQWQALGFDADSVYADPLLTETYRLGAGSPARSAGANLSSFFSTDTEGNRRPTSGAWDIGAYQSGEAPPPPPPPPPPTPPAGRGLKRSGAKLFSFFR